jgi:hypothetical protein
VLQTYAGIVANLLGSATAAHLKGRLADQLKAALVHSAIIEQAKHDDGMVPPQIFQFER